MVGHNSGRITRLAEEREKRTALFLEQVIEEAFLAQCLPGKGVTTAQLMSATFERIPDKKRDEVMEFLFDFWLECGQMHPALNVPSGRAG